jgi:DNA-binding MarR family transcriptional regulator
MTSSRSDRRPRKGFDSLEQEAFLNLWRTYDRLRRLEDELFSQYELTPQQYNALRLLRGEHPGSLPTLALAARLVSHAPDITRLLDRLVGRGLIRRQRPTENRRQVQVSITSDGLALLKKLDKLVRKCHEEQLGHLSADELRRLIHLLEAARAPHEAASSLWNPPEP